MSITKGPMSEELRAATELRVSEVLTQLRIPWSFKGYRHLTIAVTLVIERPERLERVTKEIYPEVALRCQSKHFRVERCMRIVVNRCWAEQREALDQIAGYHLSKRPTNTEFMELIARYVMRT